MTRRGVERRPARLEISPELARVCFSCPHLDQMFFRCRVKLRDCHSKRVRQWRKALSEVSDE